MQQKERNGIAIGIGIGIAIGIAIGIGIGVGISIGIAIAIAIARMDFGVTNAANTGDLYAPSSRYT